MASPDSWYFQTEPFELRWGQEEYRNMGKIEMFSIKIGAIKIGLRVYNGRNFYEKYAVKEQK